MKKCPYCKEEIQDVAVKCKHCHELLQPEKNTPNVPSPPKRSNAPTILSWGFGTLFIFAGLARFVESPLSAILILVMAGLLLPPIRKLVGDKTGVSIPVLVRGIALIVLLAVSGLIHDNQVANKAEEQAKAGGFESVSVYQEAQKVGASTKSNYEDYLEKEKKEKIAALEKSLASAKVSLYKIGILRELVALDSKNYLYQVELSQAQDEHKRYLEKTARERKEASEANKLENQPWYTEGRSLPITQKAKKWHYASPNDKLRTAADFIKLHGRSMSRFSFTAKEWKTFADSLSSCISGKISYASKGTLLFRVAEECQNEIGRDW